MRFFFHKAIKDISENRLLNAVAMITIALSVMIVSAFGLFYINANEILTSWKSGIRVMAYLSPTADSAAVSEAKQMIESISGVQYAAFIDRESALETFRMQLKGQESILDNLRENPLPDAYEVHLDQETRTEDRVAALARQISSIPAVTEVEYGQQWMGSMMSVLNLFRFAGYAMGGLFFMAAVFIVANTIRLILYSRREEVEIMRLVGATDGFIQAPFFIEGILQGLAGAVFGLGALFLSYVFIASNIGQDYFGSGFKLQFFSFGTSGLIVIVSMLIGWVGCYLSIKQFLK